MAEQDRGGRRQPRFDLIDLELFAGVVEAGSITHGAARVHLTLPSASARIRLMEAAIRTPLLVRGRRGVAPTIAGQLLLRHARTVLSQMDRLTGDLAEFSDGVAASVRVLANTSAVASDLPDILTRFLLDHGNFDVDLVERPSHAIVEEIAAGRAEIGIVADTVPLGELERSPLRPDPLVLITPPNHPLAGRDSVSFSEVLPLPFVGLSEGSALQEHLEGQALPLGQRPRYRVRLPNAPEVCGAVAAGIGVGVLPAAVVARQRSGSSVAAVPLLDPWADRRLLLCTHAKEELSAPAALLAAHFLSALGNTGATVGPGL